MKVQMAMTLLICFIILVRSFWNFNTLFKP